MPTDYPVCRGWILVTILLNIMGNCVIPRPPDVVNKSIRDNLINIRKNYSYVLRIDFENCYFNIEFTPHSQDYEVCISQKLRNGMYSDGKTKVCKTVDAVLRMIDDQGLVISRSHLWAGM